MLTATGQTPRALAREKRHRTTVLLFDNLANHVLLLVSAQQRLAWALALCVGTQRERKNSRRTWTLAPDLIWSIGSLMASASSWMPGWTRVLAQVARQSTMESSTSYDSEQPERRVFNMSKSSAAILAAEVARVERATRVGSLHRHDHQVIRNVVDKTA